MELLVALRPWSLPASVVPTVLAAALSLGAAPARAQLADAALAVACGALVHLAANAANTYADFASGLDTKAAADDRALVDGHVTPRAVAALAAALYAAALAVAARLALGLGLFGSAAGAAAGGAATGSVAPLFAAVIAAGVLLSLLYSAGLPFRRALKHVGLGDLAIFLCFGPLLMGATAAAVTRAAPALPVLLMSAPVGLLTVNILHANNARDSRADAAAGAVTVARLLGFRRSLAYYWANFALSYALTAAALVLALAERAGAAPAELGAALAARARADPRGLLRLLLAGASASPAAPAASAAEAAAVGALRAVGLLLAPTLPWEHALVGRFKRRELATLPQATAQFHLLFGACVLGGLLPAAVFARLLAAAGARAAVGALDLAPRLRALLPAGAARAADAAALAVGVAAGMAAQVFAFGPDAPLAPPWPAARDEAAGALAALLLAGSALSAGAHDVGFDAAAELREVEGEGEGAGGVGAGAAPAKAAAGARKRRQSGASPTAAASAASSVAVAAAVAPAAAAPAGAAAATQAAFDAAFTRVLTNFGLAAALMLLA